MSAPPPSVGSTSAATLVAAGRDYAVAVAPGKVNLFLELRGKRPDGFHDLETLLVPVDLADTLEVRAVAGSDTHIECDTPGVPADGRNLVAKAADALAEHTGARFGVHVRLTKRVPHAAGLGGGSSDAAAMLVALNHIFALNLSPETLMLVAGRVGSDVPAFLVGPAAWCTGRGEVVTPAPVGGELFLVVVKPDAGLSTAAVYARCAVPADPVRGTAVRSALAAGDVRGVAAGLFNRLERSAFALLPEAAAVRDALVRAGALAALVSGSGSGVFGVCETRADAARVAGSVAGSGRVFVVTVCPGVAF